MLNKKLCTFNTMKINKKIKPTSEKQSINENKDETGKMVPDIIIIN